MKSSNGKPIRLADVAEVKIGAVPLKWATLREVQNLLSLFQSQNRPNANTLEVTQKIEKNLADLHQNIPCRCKDGH
ncbi:MAG: efflux RND transporter permease subunit [Saprospiraceae bacterium]|nr:efflux RND transporter permease subunit [Saprospiraceae bacterium]